MVRIALGISVARSLLRVVVDQDGAVRGTLVMGTLVMGKLRLEGKGEVSAMMGLCLYK